MNSMSLKEENKKQDKKRTAFDSSNSDEQIDVSIEKIQIETGNQKPLNTKQGLIINN